MQKLEGPVLDQPKLNLDLENSGEDIILQILKPQGRFLFQLLESFLLFGKLLQEG